MTGWLPIATAPKDGSWVLVYGNVWAGEPAHLTPQNSMSRKPFR